MESRLKERHLKDVIDDMNTSFYVIEKRDLKKTPNDYPYMDSDHKELITEYIRLRKTFTNKQALQTMLIEEYKTRYTQKHL